MRAEATQGQGALPPAVPRGGSPRSIWGKMRGAAGAVWAGLGLALWAAGAAAQGFAGLGATADEGFAVPERGRVLVFPDDHLAHPDFRIEWWYLTANLRDADGRDYGAQWTLFRFARAPGAAEGWASAQGWMGHAAVTTPGLHLAAERFARGGTGQAGVAGRPFRAWIDDWVMESRAGPGQDDFDVLDLQARGEGFAYRLEARAEGPLVLHGDAGYSVKSAGGQASHYYSQPFLEVTGEIELAGGAPVAVTGQAWLDREWSSQPLAAGQMGWDWFAVHLEGGAKVMAARVRDGSAAPFLFGTWVAADGRAEPASPGEIALVPLSHAEVAGRRVPVSWQLVWQARGLDLRLEALNPSSWMDTAISYWEGPARVTGSHSGLGFMELTGY